MRRYPSFYRGKYHKINKDNPNKLRKEIHIIEYMFAKLRDIIKKNKNIEIIRGLVLDRLRDDMTCIRKHEKRLYEDQEENLINQDCEAPQPNLLDPLDFLVTEAELDDLEFLLNDSEDMILLDE